MKRNYRLALDHQDVKNLMKLSQESSNLGTLRDYLCEFKKLVKKVRGWTQRALVGGLKAESFEGIWMFKP